MVIACRDLIVALIGSLAVSSVFGVGGREGRPRPRRQVRPAHGTCCRRARCCAATRIALGANPVGHKQQQGDERTPEGRYVLDWRNPNSCCMRSLHISYPNAADKAAARQLGVDPGGMIMIHGQPNGFGWWSWLMQLFDWTNGCIAVTDEDMLRDLGHGERRHADRDRSMSEDKSSQMCERQTGRSGRRSSRSRPA